MTTLNKIILGTTLAAIIGAGIYQRQETARHRLVEASLQEEVGRLRTETRRLTREHEEDSALLGAVQIAIDSARRGIAAQGTSATPSQDPLMEAELKSVLARVITLKERMAATTSEQIPELRFLTDQAWINAATKHKLENDKDLSLALSDVRNSAKIAFADVLAKGLWRYAQANDGQIPTDISLLAPYIDQSVPAELLGRYGITHAGKLADLDFSQIVIAELPTADRNRDGDLFIGGPRTEIAQNNITIHGGEYSDVSVPFLRAISAFIKANTGSPLAAATQLDPYLPSGIDRARIQGMWKAVGMPKEMHSPRD
jgi:hypothetical protein